MGLFNRLFGKGSKEKIITNTTKLLGTSTFLIDIVGESRYQSALESICGKRSDVSQEKLVEAVLVCEDDNPYDDKAVRVDIQGKTVGYLSREIAREYRRRLNESGHKNDTTVCFAKIVGGWDRGSGDKGNFGVKLDLPADLSNISEFRFSIVQPNIEECAQIERGDSVNFWSPADNPSKIYIYRRGSIGGLGKLGLVPNTFSGMIASHRAKGLPIEAEILDVTTSTCTIYCRLVQAKEIEKDREEEQNKLRTELMKPYRPRKPIEFSIDAKSYTLNIKEQLRLTQIPSIDECTNNIHAAKLVFFSLDGKKVIEKKDEPDIKKKIVRLAHTFDNLDVLVVSKSKEKDWYKSEYKLQMKPVIDI